MNHIGSLEPSSLHSLSRKLKKWKYICPTIARKMPSLGEYKMFGVLRAAKGDAHSVFDSLHRALAMIEFDMFGRVISANSNFCALLDYDPSDIKGQHYSMFVEPEYSRSADYAEFWKKLGRGEFEAGQYKLIGRDGKGVWTQSTYSPIRNSRGDVVKVVNILTDITPYMTKNNDLEKTINAISRAQAVVEFTASGEIITANANFLNLMGYNLDEIKGRPHHIFVDATYAASQEYFNFWSKLRRGESVTEEFKRIGKDGHVVWLQASYNPIFDADDNITKIVQFSTDITNRALAIESISRNISQLTKNLGATFASMKQIAAVIAEITRSPQRQVGGLCQAKTTIDLMDQMTRQNVAMVEAAVASGVKLEVDTIANLIGPFDARDRGSGPVDTPVVSLEESTVVRLRPSRAASTPDPDDRRGRGGGPAATLAFPSRKDRS
jgi:PAS domain S-box-containing protein